MGRALFQRVIDEYSDTDPNEAKCASEQLAMSLLEDGYRDDAEAAFRRTLLLIAQSPIGRSYTTGLTYLSLAELLYSKGDRASQLEAWQLLDAVEESAVGQGRLFRDAAIRYLVARARVATALRDPAAASFARAALEIADETTPSIPRHPTLGRPCASDELRFELTSIEARFSRGVNRRRAPFARRATSARRS
jgi:aryl-alcohol dehydrogenase-like predicted oxidoreductase